MNKKLLQVMALFACFFIITACGNSGSSDGTSSTDNSTATETSSNQEEQEKEKTDSEAKTDPTEKYKDIKDVLLALENEEYDRAIDLINAMKSEPETQVVKIDMENWAEYFSVEVRPRYNYDAMKNIKEISEMWYLSLKPEYKEKLVSISGEAGVEAAYEEEVRKIINVDKDTGAYETKVMDMDSLKAEYAEITGNMGGSDGPYFNDWEISSTVDMAADMSIMDTDITALQPHTTSGGSIRIKDAEEWTQYIRYPKINIVRIEGEMVLSK